jgi:hypothetical protein
VPLAALLQQQQWLVLATGSDLATLLLLNSLYVGLEFTTLAMGLSSMDPVQ